MERSENFLIAKLAAGFVVTFSVAIISLMSSKGLISHVFLWFILAGIIFYIVILIYEYKTGRKGLQDQGG